MKFTKHRIRLKDRDMPLIIPSLRCICGHILVAQGNSSKKIKLLDQKMEQHIASCKNYKHFQENKMVLQAMTLQDVEQALGVHKKDE